ncbi:GYDIA family GHMP kinase [Psychroserpens sp. MEBiC05023]
MKKNYSHGKLLLTGEYVVLDGAKALAVPTLYGQSLNIEKGSHNKLRWISLDDQNQVWFETEYKLSNNEILNQAHNDNPISRRLLQILKAAKELNSRFLSDDTGYTITTTLDFPKNWGLGTSSTLISNIANWANIDPYKLLEMTFGGSGYDIACAQATSSLSYQLDNTKQPIIQDVSFNPAFKQHLYFVYLNQKQDSRDGIAQYRTNTSDLSASIARVSEITNSMIVCDTLKVFQELMNEHELIISDIIKQTPIKARLFNDFKGSIKSLGAWGGDFIMVASEANPAAYFQAKGYSTILSYSEMVKN